MSVRRTSRPLNHADNKFSSAPELMLTERSCTKGKEKRGAGARRGGMGPPDGEETALMRTLKIEIDTPSADSKVRFTEHGIEDAPDSPGVYALWEGQDIIYVDKADSDGVTIRSCLRSHLRGEKGACTKAATHYSIVEGKEPIDIRLKNVLDAWEGHRKERPRCNEPSDQPQKPTGSPG
jgi:hypothetical protein